MKISNTLFLGLSVGLISLPSLSVTVDDMHQTSFQKDFKALDIDGNGRLNATEIKKDELFNKGGFAKADKNHNGSLSENEYANFKSAEQQKETKRVAKDSTITSKIKSKYLLEKNFKSLDVSVETKEGVVVLSGFVDDESTKARAEQIAAMVKGVKSVNNGLIVKP